MRLQLLITIAISALLITSCNEDIEVAKGYPTTIEEVSTIDLNKILGQIEQTPMANCVTVSNFGFIFLDYESESCFDIDNWKNDSTENVILARTQKAFTKYANFLNLSEGSNPEIKSISTHNGIDYDNFFKEYPDSLPPVWIATTSPQKHEDYEIRGTNLQVMLSPDEIIGISGHWYSNINIPISDNYNVEQSQEMLINSSFTYSSSNELLISDDTNWHTAKKVIVPIARSKQLELHVCWALYPDSWEILIDTQTGEVLSSIDISAI
jgi:Zn-dependent metalloprotease